jgi:hypothetical protein
MFFEPTQDDGLVGVLKKNNRLVLMGRGAWVRVRTLKAPAETTERINRNVVLN